MNIHSAHADMKSLGAFARELVISHLENPEIFNAEYVLSALVNEYFMQEIRNAKR